MRALLEASRKKIAEEAAARAAEEKAREMALAAEAAQAKAAQAEQEGEPATDLALTGGQVELVSQPTSEPEEIAPLITQQEAPKLVAAQAIALPLPGPPSVTEVVETEDPDAERFFDDDYGPALE